MPDYKETSVSGQSYQRSHRIIVENKRGDTPHITFLEEQVLTIGTEEIHRDAGQITAYFDPAKAIPLINPLTDEPMGIDGTHAQLQIILYSLYKQQAAERDAAANP